MKNFILMIQFLTRIPIPITIDVKEDSFVKGVAYYPLVGVIIGFINAGVYLLTSNVIGGAFPIVCVLLANTLVTGAFHLDGIADTCDGIYSARPKEQMLEIMKDSRVGTNGAIALIFDYIFRYVLLSTIPSSFILYAIILAPIAAKTQVGLLIYISKYARKKGLAGLYLDKMTKLPTVICMIIGITIFGVTLRIKGLILVGVYTIFSLLFKRYIYKRIDGMTGDTLGAANEVIEILALFTFNLI